MGQALGKLEHRTDTAAWTLQKATGLRTLGTLSSIIPMSQTLQRQPSHTQEKGLSCLAPALPCAAKELEPARKAAKDQFSGRSEGLASAA